MPSIAISFAESALRDIEEIKDWYTNRRYLMLAKDSSRNSFNGYRHDTDRVRVVRVWRSERLLRLAPEDN